MNSSLSQGLERSLRLAAMKKDCPEWVYFTSKWNGKVPHAELAILREGLPPFEVVRRDPGQGATT